MIVVFKLFKKRAVDKKKVEDFANWFAQNSSRIIQSVENRNTDSKTLFSVLDDVEKQLANIYRDGYKGDIEFEYGGMDNQWELNLYHLNNKFLIEATSLISVEINKRLPDLWVVNISD